MKADDALASLIEGNNRYVKATAGGYDFQSPVKHHQLLLEQKPFAIILGCSDSRVPAEMVFDQGAGDLFVIRVAGNIVAPSQIGSVEFACQQFNTQLVVVLGHTRCGAISATVDSLIGDPDQMSPNLAAIVDRVTPAAYPIIEKYKSCSRDELLHKTMRANVEQSVHQLELRSRIIRKLIRQKQLKIVGAEYSIESGKVDFY